MPPSRETAPTPAVDFLEQPLTEGDRVAFNTGEDGRLYVGNIRMVERDAYQLVVHSGHLLIIEGDLRRANGGKPERIKFDQVVRLPSEDAGLFDEIVRRHKGAAARVDELLAVIEGVRAVASRLEEFGENALKNDDRKLYTAIAKDLRARIDGPTPGDEEDDA